MWSRWTSGIIMVAVLALLAGCAGMSLQTRFNDEAELRSARGEPTEYFENDDGTRTLVYSTQPYGETAWMYTVNEQGVIVEQFDALEHRNHSRVQTGMSVEEVRRTLGDHRSIQRFALSGEEVWDWNVPNPYPGLVATYFNVHFVDGEVVRTSYTYVHPRNGGMSSFGMFHSGGPGWGIGLGYPFGSSFGWSYPGWPHYW